MTTEAIPESAGSSTTPRSIRPSAALARTGRADAASASTAPTAVEAFRLRWLGRKQGRLNEVSSRWLKAAPPEAKKAVGERFKTLKELVERLLEQGSGAGASDAALAAEAIDITLPGTRRLTGAEHPITRTLNEIVSVFAALGYSVGVGPEVETDFYNFECMNFPPGHPARDTQDTLVIANQERRPRAIACSCAPTPRPCRCAPWSSSRRPSASSSPARSTATTPPTPRTRPSSIRSKASASTPTSPSPTSRARSITP